MRVRAAIAAWLLMLVAQPATAQAVRKVEPWTILAAIESSRPAFTVRALTEAERAELPTLLRAYRGAGKTSATLARLTELGETGDREAMIAVRDALSSGPPRDTLAAFDGAAEARDYYATLSRVLAALWTAHLWQMHGFERAGLPLMSACVAGLQNDRGYILALPDGNRDGRRDMPGEGLNDRQLGCGFVLQSVRQQYIPPGMTVRPEDRLPYYRDDPKYGGTYPNDDVYIIGARFFPVWGDGAFLEARFQAFLGRLRQGFFLETGPQGFAPGTKASPAFRLSTAFYYGYAERTGRSDLIAAARAEGRVVKAEANAQSDRDAAFARARAAEDKRRNDIAQWEGWMADTRARSVQPSMALMTLSSTLGGEYWDQYVALAGGSPTARLATAAPAGGGAAPSSYRPVEIRTYDASGTYTGSTQTSAFWADVLKMTAPPPR